MRIVHRAVFAIASLDLHVDPLLVPTISCWGKSKARGCSIQDAPTISHVCLAFQSVRMQYALVVWMTRYSRRSRQPTTRALRPSSIHAPRSP